MKFFRHSDLAGKHSFLSPSSPAWVNYEDDKLDRVYVAHLAAQRGVAMHELASSLINLGVKLPDVEKTINMYVNDGIGYRMKTEVVLFYSANCYGQVDAIAFRKNILRISDLKTGRSATSMAQLKVYAALFCLEYRYNPFDIQVELRIYQSDSVKLEVGDPDEIMHIMEKIKSFDKRITQIREEAE